MTSYNPIFRSPITGAQPPSGLGPQTPNPQLLLTLADLSGVPVILIQGEAGELLLEYFLAVPAKPGDLVAVGEGLLARLTPTNFYLFGLSLLAKLPSANQLDDSFAKHRCIAHATDFTHGKAVFKLAGATARQMLSKICGLDFQDQGFPNLHVAQTSAAKIKTLIARFDQVGELTYFLHIDRPLGQYFWEIMREAGQEFEIRLS